MDVDKHIEKAEDAFKRRNYDFAINLYRQLLLIDPNNLKARQGLFQAAVKSYEMKHAGRRGKARRSSALGASLGILLLSGGRKEPRHVMAACDKVISKHPYDPHAHEKLGYAAARAGCLEAAVFAFEKVLEFQAGNLAAAKNLGRLHQRLGHIEAALESFDRALQIHPGDQEALKARKDLAAEAAIQGHGYAEARSAMDLVKDRDKARELDLTERVVLGEEEIAETIARVQERLEAEPEDKKLLLRLGELYEQQGELARAQEVFERLSALEPTNFDHRERIGDLKIRAAEEQVRELEEAGAAGDALAQGLGHLRQLRVEEYSWRVEAHPTDLPLRFRYGEALFAVGRLDEAIGEFQKTVKAPRKRLDSLVMMASAFTRQGMLELAENQLRRALEAAGEGTRRGMEIRYNLGLLLEKEEKLEAARAEYLQVYERDINFKDVKDRLQGLERKSSPG